MWGCVFPVYPIPLWWLRMREYIYICTLSHYHHQIRSMKYYPLFRVRSWNNGVHCMSFYILIKVRNKYSYVHCMKESIHPWMDGWMDGWMDERSRACHSGGHCWDYTSSTLSFGQSLQLIWRWDRSRWNLRTCDLGMICRLTAGTILWMRPANERRRYNVTSSLIGWAHTQNDLCLQWLETEEVVPG